jgi:hypothetical protein
MRHQLFCQAGRQLVRDFHTSSRRVSALRPFAQLLIDLGIFGTLESALLRLQPHSIASSGHCQEQEHDDGESAIYQVGLRDPISSSVLESQEM